MVQATLVGGQRRSRGRGCPESLSYPSVRPARRFAEVHQTLPPLENPLLSSPLLSSPRTAPVWTTVGRADRFSTAVVTVSATSHRIRPLTLMPRARAAKRGRLRLVPAASASNVFCMNRSPCLGWFGFLERKVNNMPSCADVSLSSEEKRREEGRAACQVLRDWKYNGGREPTAREILLAVAHLGWAGWSSRPVESIYEGFLTHYWLYDYPLSRPERWIPHEDGRGMTSSGRMVPAQNLVKAVELLRRYKEFCRYMRETRHSWQKVDEIHWADNSVDVVEVSQLTGEERRRMVVAPGGDVCF